MLGDLVYENENYKIIILEKNDVGDTDNEYGVIHKVHDVVEYRSASVTQAMYQAEVYDRDIKGKMWLAEVERTVPMEMAHVSTKPELLN